MKKAFSNTAKPILFFLGHPAHFHLFHFVLKELCNREREILICIKSKDVLESLVKAAGFKYINLFSKGRRYSKLSIALEVGVRELRLYSVVHNFRPSLMVGTSTEITHVGKLTGIPSIVVNEDDAEAVPLFVKFAYPWASTILVPSGCSVGAFEKKTIFYHGYHELAYLMPHYFKPDSSRIPLINVDKPYFIMRFSGLNAHHDAGKRGISDEFALQIIKRLSPHGRVYISSERQLKEELEAYRIHIKPENMHHALAFALLYIGDSQTMTAEAAVLGTPALRFNDFVGKLNYLEELEHRYELTYGIPTNQPERLLQKIDELLAMSNLKEEWRKRRARMLADKIDVTAFMTWFIETYPESKRIMLNRPDEQYRFKCFNELTW